MWRPAVLLALLLTGCSKGPDADLQYIKQARSLGAEWALVNEQSGEGKLTSTYINSMHQWLRDNLTTTQSSLSDPHARYAVEIKALLAEPDDASPEELRGHAERLKQIEDGLESA